ncbi:glycosyltransferase family 8 protein [Cellulomonas gilvus]|uniref:Glycosyl transferase family 8 n=1 Tax=Cellulomonas gilvus (strain ATCC 13127 / NRRL B-14078) TaxID=593907 RepID=F8A183_CELGA|nr:glycosyltransferase [Cellulomonas gilvus]AEI11630.1 glycosyl transferase family 8 [Cellulomonas gilvus ATCC 13127]
MATSRPAPGARTIVRSVLDRLPFEVSRRRPTRSASSPSDASAARLDQTRAELRQMVHAYRGLVAASQGVQASDLGPVPLAAPDASTRLANRRAVQALRRDAELVRAIERGSDLPEAAVAYVRALLKRPEAEHAQVRSFAHALQRDEATAVVGRLCEAVVASAKGLEELARTRFAQVPAELWGRHALVEHVSVAGRLGDDAMIDDAVAAARVPGAPVHGVLHVAEVCLATGRLDVARELLDVVAAHEVGDEEVDRRVRWLRPWLATVATPEPSPEGVIALGVIDYKQPDLRNTSSNLGDYVQTAAAFGHWLRHSNLTITGDEPDLVDAVTQMHGRVRADLRLDTPARTVRLVRVDRDASHHNPIPDATWTIAFGWYMHGQFGTGYDFPFHENVRPIFVSFHCNRRDMLTPEAVEYLKAHGPIGCRDWNTVYLLLSMGVPAFFSGCLTTTIDAYYEPVTAPPAASRPPVWVDVPAPAGGAYITQASDDVRWTAAGPNLIDALDLLERYRSEFGTVVTSRLHCFLPAWAIGADVDFQPHNRADVRFAGLLDADEDGRKAIQSRIRRLLEAVTTRILAGDDEATVRAAWAELCAPEIEIARARLAEPAAAHALSFDLAAACATVRSEQRDVPASAPRDGEVVDLALALDGNLKEEFAVVVTGLVEGTQAPLRLWVLCRDHDQEDFDRVARQFPEVHVTWLPCDHVDYGPVLGMLRHITVATMDRLLLPDLLPELTRITYVDIDTLPIGDVAQLAAWDLAGAPLAARDAVARGASSGFGNLHSTARRLRTSPTAANELLRLAYQRHAFDFDAFNAGILVLDLERMRADDFGPTFLPWVEQFGMNDQELLNAYAGADRAVLPGSWNALPTQEVLTDPQLIHWAGWLKPWRAEYVAHQDLWLAARERTRARLAD